MATKSVLNDSKQVERAVALINLGARLQVLESETDLSYERLLRLYKEVAGRSPSKGQLPFSTEWFLTWQPNIHASLFQNTYQYLSKVSALEDIDAGHAPATAKPERDLYIVDRRICFANGKGGHDCCEWRRQVYAARCRARRNRGRDLRAGRGSGQALQRAQVG